MIDRASASGLVSIHTITVPPLSWGGVYRVWEAIPIRIPEKLQVQAVRFADILERVRHNRLSAQVLDRTL
ncbi:MAG TPA: hypothetical protein VLU47_16170, partial [Blastocatellia bacterium]|nr:hypothetical protein [Blastocatellia bacterium]